MKLEFIKQAGGVLVPASDLVSDKLTKFKTGGLYEVEIKRQRNPHFHAKAFSFFKFCFEYWCGNKTHWENLDTKEQFDSFRKDLTIQAGYFNQIYTLDGLGFKLEAKSLSFGNMEQGEFEACYNALINAAIKNVFQNTRDEQILNRLQGFF